MSRAAKIAALFGLASILPALNALAASPMPPATILFGAAYYEEYEPTDRLAQDVAMMKAAHISVVRIAESTWATLEPREGVFDFTHVDRVLDAMDKAGIKVIIGTPTYAIPAWLAAAHPDVLVTTREGHARYGARQNMDITSPVFRQAAQRVIVALVDHVKDHPCVIGYQLDNETKSYGVSGAAVQARFKGWLQQRHPDLNELNASFGLDYWSNRVNDWKDLPSTDGAVNASLTTAFAEFQRGLVSEYLLWQNALVRAHARPDQFLTHNFDLDWRGYSYGIQPEVNHFDAAKAVDVAGVDIYHPTQDHLTGAEIALGGDLARSLKGGRNYLVLETQAQGFPEWTPYPGQLRLQAFSHLASGASMVEYWHWATTHNSVETYWRGLLAQDYQANPAYDEAAAIGADLARLGPQLAGLRKHNAIAVYVSNRALSGFNAFRFGWTSPQTYNDVLRPFYDALYRMNAEVDFIDPSVTDLSGYRLIVAPALYEASATEIERLNAFARAGGHLVYTFKSGVSDENLKVRSTVQPGLINEAAGVAYSQFTIPAGVSLEGDPYRAGPEANRARWWMELLTPTTAKVLATYHHPVWGAYAAVTRNTYGKGDVTYIGFMPSDGLTDKIMQEVVRSAGLWGPAQADSFPVIVRSGTLANGHEVHYLLNYSATASTAAYGFKAGADLLSGARIDAKSSVTLPPWGVAVIEEGG